MMKMLRLKQLMTAPIPTRVAVLIIILYALILVFAPAIAPFGESRIVGDSLAPWSRQFIFGTDDIGRDIFSRLLFAIRNTVSLALAASISAFFIGSTGGLFAAAAGGWVDNILSRLSDAVMALPQLILALLLLSILGDSVLVLISIIAILDASRIFRISRAVAMNIVSLPFVESARVRGENIWWLMWREILPNALAPLLAEFGVRFCYVFLFISGLSFLGLGLQPPTADLGTMVRETSTLISFGDFTPLIPATAIALLTISVNLVIDWSLQAANGPSQ